MQLFPSAIPTARVEAQATYDPLRKEVVLFSGSFGTTPFNDTWRWDGTRWLRVDVEALPPASYEGAFVYERAKQRFVSYGPQTWVLQWTSSIHDEVCQVGFDGDGDGLQACADPDCDPVCSACGNTICDPSESCRGCPVDCGACGALCGDTYCDSGEAQTCPGDCP